MGEWWWEFFSVFVSRSDFVFILSSNQRDLSSRPREVPCSVRLREVPFSV
jgi:hypothetical protein